MQSAPAAQDVTPNALFGHVWLPTNGPADCSDAPLLALIAMSIAGEPTVADARELVTTALEHDLTRLASTRDMRSTEVSRFWRYLGHMGVATIGDITPELAREFIEGPVRRGARWAAPAESTQRNRRAAVRHIFEVLRGVGFKVGDPTLDLALTERRARREGRVTDVTMERLQAAAPHELVASRRAVVLALAQAGATNSEITQIRVADVNLVERSVALPGGTRLEPRTNRLTEWGHHVLSDVLAESDGMTPLVPIGASSAASTVSNSMSDLSRAAAIRPRATVESVRAWRAGRLFDTTNSIEHVARFLGTRSLDVACEVVGYQWRSDE